MAGVGISHEHPGAGRGPRIALPSRKVGASAIAGALTIVVVFILNNAIPAAPKITGEVASALTTLLTLLVGYFVPEP
jgi:hypothetical protein